MRSSHAGMSRQWNALKKQRLRRLVFRRCRRQREELFGLFSPIGEILELYILRNSNGKSRGCAFVTYANKFLAQQAITQLNGKQVRCSPFVAAMHAWTLQPACTAHGDVAARSPYFSQSRACCTHAIASTAASCILPQVHPCRSLHCCPVLLIALLSCLADVQPFHARRCRPAKLWSSSLRTAQLRAEPRW